MSLPVRAEQTHLTHPQYRSDIDGLRAIAVLSVVGYHAFPYWIKGGFIGVDIFFVISGFLISTIIFDNLERNSFSFVEFYIRRIKRIFPALLLVMASSFVIGWLALMPIEFEQLGKHIVGGVGFVSNIVLWNESGYFDNSAATKPLLHLWSLGIEEQFYIGWPLLLVFVWKRKWNFVAITAIVAAVSFAINIYTVSKDQNAAFYLPSSRFWELLIGGLLAYAGLHKPHWISRHKNAQSISGFILLALAFVLLNKERAYPGWWALLPTLGVFLLISAGQNTWLNRYVLSNKLLVWVGLISYPLYLWHWPLLSFARIIGGQIPSQGISVAIVLVSIALAWMTYVWAEKPIRRSANNKYLWALLIGMTLIFAIGTFTYLKDGLLNRDNVNALRYKAWIEDNKSFNLSRFSDKSCPEKNQLKLVSEEVCLSNSETPTTLFVGDSHAMALYSAIQVGKFESKSILISGHSCLPYANLDYTPTFQHTWNNNCTEIAYEALKFAEANNSISTVVIANYAPSVERGKESKFRKNGIALDAESAFIEGNGYLIDKLLKRGKNVVYMIDVPHFEYEPLECERRRPSDCQISESEFISSRANYMRNIHALQNKYPNLKIFDGSSIFCKNGICSERDNDLYLYHDNHHISVYGSEKILNLLSSRKFIN